MPETQTLVPAQVRWQSVGIPFFSLKFSGILNNTLCPFAVGAELDWSNDVMRRIQESSYIQEQYVLTRCSISSERGLQMQSLSLLQASSNSDSAGVAFLTDPESSGSALDTGSLPQGLEKMPSPEQRSSLSRWADAALQQNLLPETQDNAAKKVKIHRWIQ